MFIIKRNERVIRLCYSKHCVLYSKKNLKVQFVMESSLFAALFLHKTFLIIHKFIKIIISKPENWKVFLHDMMINFYSIENCSYDNLKIIILGTFFLNFLFS